MKYKRISYINYHFQYIKYGTRLPPTYPPVFLPASTSIRVVLPVPVKIKYERNRSPVPRNNRNSARAMDFQGTLSKAFGV